MVKRILAFTNPAFLSMRMSQLVVSHPGPEKEEITTIPIEDIGVIILDHKQITITQSLLSSMIANNIAVISSQENHMPVGLFLPLDGHNLQQERFTEQINSSEPLRKNMWQQTIKAKIRNQSAVLSLSGVENRNMQKWISNVKSGDTDNLEGRAAVYYWKNIFSTYPKFVRGQNEPYPNNLLNYGYAIVRALMARALVAAGLLPTFGIHHHNRYNAYCLADDIMEPYRPYVDAKVVQMTTTYTPQEIITKEMKKDLLELPFTDVVIDGHRSPMMVAIQITANSLRKCFSGECRKISFPEL